MIRFSAALVVAGLGLLLAGAVASELPLIYAAIAVSVCAALALTAGVIAGRDEIFGRGATAGGDERAADRGATPGPGGAAIPAEAVSAGPQPLAGRGPAAALNEAHAAAAADRQAAASTRDDPAAAAAGASPAAADSPGPSYSGLGWPAGRSPSDELWARVDAELSAAGASVRTPKLTKDSAADEVPGRVEQELISPAPRNPGLVVPAAGEHAAAKPAPDGGERVTTAEAAAAEPETPADRDTLAEPETPADRDTLAEPETPADRDTLTEPDNPADQDAPGDLFTLTGPGPGTEQAPDTEPASDAGAADAAAQDAQQAPDTEPVPGTEPASDAEPASEAGPSDAAAQHTQQAPDTGSSDAAAPESAASEAAAPGAWAGPVIVVTGVSRYHRPDCRLIRFLRGKDTQSVTREEAVATGCSPCPECRPQMSPAGAGSPGR